MLLDRQWNYEIFKSRDGGAVVAVLTDWDDRGLARATEPAVVGLYSSRKAFEEDGEEASESYEFKTGADARGWLNLWATKPGVKLPDEDR